MYIEFLPSCLISTSSGLSVDGRSRCIEMNLSGSKVLYMLFLLQVQYLSRQGHENLHGNPISFPVIYVWPVDLFQKVGFFLTH